jgi:hypothetical protein
MRTSEAWTLFPRRWMVDHGVVNELVAVEWAETEVEEGSDEFSGEM